MPYKDPKKRKEYVDKYNREHPIPPEKRSEYYYKSGKYQRYLKSKENMYAQEKV